MATNIISRRGRCKYCGKLVHVGDNRCPNCGKPLSWGSSALSTTNSPSENDGEKPSEQQTTSDVATSSPNTQPNSISRSTEPISGGEHNTTTNRIGRCKYCGKIVHVGDNRCLNCGHELSWTKQSAESAKITSVPKYHPPTKTEDSDRVKYWRNLHIGSWVVGSLFFICLAATTCQDLKVLDALDGTGDDGTGNKTTDFVYQTQKVDKDEQAYLREREKLERYSSIDWKSESTCVYISDTVAIYLQSVPNHIWFGKYEVTQAQWETVMGNNPSSFKNPDNPVENVSWEDCQKFLEKLNKMPSVKKAGLKFRLPTEAEWEFACRAGSTREWDAYGYLKDGTEITAKTLDQIAWFKDNADSKPHPVGQKQPNAFGLYDMHGNVVEWTSTRVGACLVKRGGCWFNSAGPCSASCRSWEPASERGDHLGFRLCASGKAH